MTGSELRGLPVGHGEAALFCAVSRVAAAHRVRTRQEHGLAVRTCDDQFDLEQPCCVAECRWLRLSVDQEQRDEPVAFVPSCPAPQQDLGVLVVEPFWLDVAVVECDRNLPAGRLTPPEHRRAGVGLAGNALVAGPGRGSGEGRGPASNADGAPERGRRQARDVGRYGLGRWVGGIQVVTGRILVLVVGLDHRALGREPAQKVALGGRLPAELLVLPAERAVQVRDDQPLQFVPDSGRRRPLQHCAQIFACHASPIDTGKS